MFLIVEHPVKLSLTSSKQQFVINLLQSNSLWEKKKKAFPPEQGKSLKLPWRPKIPLTRGPCIDTEGRGNHRSEIHFRRQSKFSFSEETHSIKSNFNISHPPLSARQEGKPRAQCFIPTVWMQLIYFHWDHSSIRAKNINVKAAIIYLHQ